MLEVDDATLIADLEQLVDPTTRGNISAPKYSTGNLDKPSALYVLPKSIEAACPSATSGSKWGASASRR